MYTYRFEQQAIVVAKQEAIQQGINHSMAAAEIADWVVRTAAAKTSAVENLKQEPAQSSNSGGEVATAEAIATGSDWHLEPKLRSFGDQEITSLD